MRRWGLLCAAVAALAYLNTLGHQFTYDDHVAIEGNPLIRDLRLLPRLVTTGYWDAIPGAAADTDRLYRPVTVASYALNYAVHGLSPRGYHAVNVALHAAASALTVPLLTALGAPGWGAGAAGLLFALHPVHSEAVASVVGRAELLAALWLLVAWRLSLMPGPRAGALALGAYALALLSKENAVSLLLLYPGAQLVLRRPLRRGLLAGLVAVTAAAVLLRYLVLGTLHQPPPARLNPLVAADGPTQVLTALHILGLYLTRLFFPLTLSADYSYDAIPLVRGLSPAPLLPVLVWSGLLAVACWRWRGLAWLAVLLIAAPLLPVSNLVFVIGTPMAERFLYLPVLGLALLIAAGLTRVPPRAAMAGLLLLALLYAGRTVRRNQDWHDDFSLWRATVQTSPRSALAHLGLGMAYLGRDQPREALREVERALEIMPRWADARNSLGVIRDRLGDRAGAIQAFEQALQEDPRHPLARQNLQTLRSGATSR